MAMRALGWAARAVIVFAGAFALLLSGQALLKANASVRPMWTGPNALTVAQGQLSRAQQAVVAAQGQVAALQQQVQQLSSNAVALGQMLTQAQAAGFGAGYAPTGRGRYRGGDDNGGF